MNTPNEFHLRDGWHFRREGDGTVVIRVERDGEHAERGIYIPATEWASIVHALAPEGTDFYKVRHLHGGALRWRDGGADPEMLT